MPKGFQGFQKGNQFGKLLKGRKLSLERIEVIRKNTQDRWDKGLGTGFKKGNTLGVGNHYNLGRKLTEEQKNKISMALKGKMPKNLSLINANKRGKGNPMYGKHPSLESLFKKSKSLKKHWRNNIERKKEAKIRLTGGNNPRWKGGITKLTLQIRHSGRYKEWRKQIFERDRYTCILCGKKDVYFEADHYKKYFSTLILEYQIKSLQEALKCKEMWEIDNGRTLCQPCHQITPNYLNNYLNLKRNE